MRSLRMYGGKGLLTRLVHGSSQHIASKRMIKSRGEAEDGVIAIDVMFIALQQDPELGQTHPDVRVAQCLELGASLRAPY